MPKGRGYGRKKMGGARRGKKSLGRRKGSKKYYVGGYVA